MPILDDTVETDIAISTNSASLSRSFKHRPHLWLFNLLDSISPISYADTDPHYFRQMDSLLIITEHMPLPIDVEGMIHVVHICVSIRVQVCVRVCVCMCVWQCDTTVSCTPHWAVLHCADRVQKWDKHHHIRAVSCELTSVSWCVLNYKYPTIVSTRP